MSSDRIRRFFVLFFVLGFFLYLFGPLLIMGLTAFNSSAFPRVSPWECFTVEWFDVLANDGRLLEGLKNSFLIGFGVVLFAVPLGLAGALMLTQVQERVRPWYYTIVISPILVPGVVLGISTLLFWDRIGVMFGASRDSIFYDGFFLTIIGQSTFIAAYTMLVFISRLQRFDPAQEEAALDLGATHVQAFRKILLPFLKPAIASAAVLAFLASFENYNTTVFTSISTSTLTTVLASKVRYGIDPSISALAVAIVVLTVFGAAIHEVVKRREEAAAKQAGMVAAGLIKEKKAQKQWFLEPAIIGILLVFIAGLGTAFFAGTIGVEECKVAVKEQKQIETAKRIEALKQKTQARKEAEAAKVELQKTERANRTGTENFNSIFSGGNLAPKSDTNETEGNDSPRTGTENFNSIFDSTNLQPEESVKPDDEAEPEARTGTENFNGIFSSGNLAPATTE
ncbi:MAG: ABC transporter permease [Acidiferrobacterales bacterium]|nr:ABC transporter permease [Acidiferrobacterales bacterium]